MRSSGAPASFSSRECISTVWDEAARHYDERQLAALVIEISAINIWNRLNVTTRQPGGSWPT